MDTLTQAKFIVASTGCSLEQAQQQIADRLLRLEQRQLKRKELEEAMEKSIENFNNKG